MSCKKHLVRWKEPPTKDATAVVETGAISDENDPSINEPGADQRGAFVHSTGFRDLLLKPELIRAITDCGSQYPSKVQRTAIPEAILETDVLCQAMSGSGKTAVFVLATLQQLDTSPGQPYNSSALTVVLCHTCELAHQTKTEYDRFSKYMPEIKTAVFHGGTHIRKDIGLLENKDTHPNVVIATPGRLKALVRHKKLCLSTARHLVLDECDEMLGHDDMRRDVEGIFRATPTQKQAMMFSTTLSGETKIICKSFMQNALEICVDDGTLPALRLDYIYLSEMEKESKLKELLNKLKFKQVIIFVKNGWRAIKLDRSLQNLSSITVHYRMSQEERIKRYKDFKDHERHICVATDVLGRGIDIKGVDLTINYDLPTNEDSYLHRAGRARRSGVQGRSISFVSSKTDKEALESIKQRFKVQELSKESLESYR